MSIVVRGVVRMMWPKTKKFVSVLWGVSFLLSLLLVSCRGKDSFTSPGKTESFLQGYNPEVIEVLWVVDTRSNMTFPAHFSNLVNEMTGFFSRLDSLASRQYRMGIVNVDGSGAIQPANTPLLTKNLGSLNARVSNFRSMFGGDKIHLGVSGNNFGFSSAANAVNSTLVPTAGVPLVVVFVSDGDDRSSSAGDAVDTYANYLLAKKNNQSDMLRVYSINYMPSGSRCFTQGQADIDNGGTQTYHRLADRLGGSKVDICSSWANTIDLSGLRLKTLPKTFTLSNAADPDSVKVTVLSSTGTYENIPFTYDSVNKQVVFDTAPPEGSTILVTYHNL